MGSVCNSALGPCVFRRSGEWVNVMLRVRSKCNQHEWEMLIRVAVLALSL